MTSRAALLIAVAAAIGVGALLSATASANNHVVGDIFGWNLGVNYDIWLMYNDGLNVDDTLEFVYDPADHNVVMVDEESYNACVVPNNTPTWNAGDDILQLSYADTFYFICGVGDHCSRGMKLAITVL